MAGDRYVSPHTPIGERSEKACRRLGNKIPDAYQRCLSFSDFWEACQKVFPSATHRCVCKESSDAFHQWSSKGTLPSTTWPSHLA